MDNNERLNDREQFFANAVEPFSERYDKRFTLQYTGGVPLFSQLGQHVSDERARFCAQCQKHVYNLSDLTTQQAVALIQSKGGKLCARFYRRADGTILTADCPVGASRAWARLKNLGAAAAAVLIAGISLPLLGGTGAEAEKALPQSKLRRVWDDAKWKVKGWLGQPQQQLQLLVMGEICVAPAVTNGPAGKGQKPR